MQRCVHVWMSMSGSVALALATAHCGVGGIGQTTASPVQPVQTSQQQANTGTTTGAGGNTTGAVDPGAMPANTGGEAGATTAAETTGAEATPGAGQTTAGATTGAATGGQNGNTTMPQDSNTALFDVSGLTQTACYYDANKGNFTFVLSNDPLFCAHGPAGVRMMQDHDLTITGDLSAQTPKANANNTNDTGAAQPSGVKATLSLYSASCTLQGSATSLRGSVTLSKADSTGCSGSFDVVMEQTMPTLSLATTTLKGTFESAPMCATLNTNTPRSKCQ